MELARLRNGKRILGYLRTDLNSPFFSKDLLWWNGAVPSYESADGFTGVKDQKGRRLFAHDLVVASFFNPLKSDRLMRIIERDGTFLLLALDSPKTMALDDHRLRELTFKSYVFLNPELVYNQSAQ